MGGELALQILQHHALVIGLHGEGLALIGAEGRQRGQVGGIFTQHRVPRLQKDLSRQIQPLLRAADHQNVICRAGDPLRPVSPGQLLPQGGQPQRSTVLQGGGAPGGEHLVSSPPEVFHRECLRRRQPAGEGDDIRPCGQRQHVPQRGCIHVRDSV